MIKWIQYIFSIFSSKKITAALKPLPKSKKWALVKPELEWLKNRKFRIVSKTYADNTTGFYVQLFLKRRPSEYYTAEYNNQTWWGIQKIKSSFLILDVEFGTPCVSYDDAIEFIKKYKAAYEATVLNEPALKLQKVRGEKYLKAHYAKNTPPEPTTKIYDIL